MWTIQSGGTQLPPPFEVSLCPTHPCAFAHHTHTLLTHTHTQRAPTPWGLWSWGVALANGMVQDWDNAGSTFSQQRAPLPCPSCIFLIPVTQGWGVKGRGGCAPGAPGMGNQESSVLVWPLQLHMWPLINHSTLFRPRIPPLSRENTTLPTLSPLVAGVGSPAPQGVPEVGRLLTLQHCFLVLLGDDRDYCPCHLPLITAAALAGK